MWRDAVGELSAGTRSENRSYLEVFAAEGGLLPAGKTKAGIEEGTLNFMRRPNRLSAVPRGKKPTELTIPEIAVVYRDYFNDVLRTIGGSGGLGKISDERGAAAFADAMFKDGRGAGARNIQRAINDIAPRRTAIDGAMGPQTLAAFREVAAKDLSRTLNALADRRIEHARVIYKDDPVTLKGVIERINHFRLENLDPPANP